MMKKNLLSMCDDVLAVILEYLDIQSVVSLHLTCKKPVFISSISTVRHVHSGCFVSSNVIQALFSSFLMRYSFRTGLISFHSSTEVISIFLPILQQGDVPRLFNNSSFHSLRVLRICFGLTADDLDKDLCLHLDSRFAFKVNNAEGFLTELSDLKTNLTYDALRSGRMKNLTHVDISSLIPVDFGLNLSEMTLDDYSSEEDKACFVQALCDSCPLLESLNIFSVLSLGETGQFLKENNVWPSLIELDLTPLMRRLEDELFNNSYILWDESREQDYEDCKYWSGLLISSLPVSSPLSLLLLSPLFPHLISSHLISSHLISSPFTTLTRHSYGCSVRCQVPHDSKVPSLAEADVPRRHAIKWPVLLLLRSCAAMV